MEPGDLKLICSSFSDFSGTSTGILDIEGRTLIASGWSDLCSRFHKSNPDTERRCMEAHCLLVKQQRNDTSFNIRRCENGLFDAAVPLFEDGEHIASFYAGQFLFAEPDIDYFNMQAEIFSFDKKTYIDALKRIPVFTVEYINKMMGLITNVAGFIGEAAIAKKKTEDIREQLIIELKESAEQIRTLKRLIPICSSCKKIRNNAGCWEQIEVYLSKHSIADFSHGLCPDCIKKLYPEIKLSHRDN